jgi:taurine dioxygenase
MQINPLSDVLGAEVVGLDAARVDDDTLHAVRRAWLDRLVLVFRDQLLTPEDHIAFSRRFGALEVHIATDHLLDGYPEIMMVSNRRENGRYIGAVSAGDYWHSDLSCKAEPSMGSLLYALELPSVGGDTAFANQYRAYETLPEATKKRIAPLRGIHTFNRMRNPRVEVPAMHRDDAQIRYGARAPDDGVHPVVRTHPETGRKALYVSPRFTVGIEGMADGEAQPLLDALFDHQDNDALRYRHTWRPGDLVFWDNRCTTHFACRGFPENEIRHMHRTTIAGDVPF